ncbi:MAG: response regulator transcription factor [Ferruginibacter sp.]
MDGYETCKWLRTHHPDIKVLVLSMYDTDSAIITMLKNGAKGYILKDSDPMQLKTALHDVIHKGYYYSELVNGRLIHAINHLGEEKTAGSDIQLSEREKDFLRYSCTELTYKEIADKMYVSPRTIDGYRDALFEKLHMKSRVGLAVYAIKNGLVDIGKA